MIELQDNHPDRYVVAKGDTLWGISARFLKDPWRWPHVWEMNKPSIKNPHWIYPGDVIVLDLINGQPQLRLLRETITLSPDIRIETLDKEAIPAISPQIIAPFLNKPLVTERSGLNDAPTIIAAYENRVALSHGHKIYINQLNENQGLHWYIYRAGNPIIDPDTKAILGTEAHYVGDAKILKYGIPATAEITKAKEEIFTGDKLIEAQEVVQNNLTPHPPEKQLSGKILSIDGGLTETGNNSIVSINLGKNDGLEEGHVLSISRVGRLIGFNPSNKKLENNIDEPVQGTSDLEKGAPNNSKRIKLPNERIGLLLVFRTFKRISYALIVQATEPIKNADLVETPQ